MQARETAHDLSSPAARDLLRQHANVFKSLGNEQRAAIICALSEGEMAVTDLAEALGLEVPNVSQHLRVLRESGVLQDRRDGKYVHYSIANPKFLEACRLIRDAMIEQSETEAGPAGDARRMIFAGRGAHGETERAR